MSWRIIHGDCLDVLPQLEAESVNLVFADPPYNIGVFKKMDPGNYLDWCEAWIAEASRVLAPNGAFWVSHSEPDVLVDISHIIERYGRGRVNWVTWDKYNGASAGEQYVMNKTKLHPQGKRSFDQDAEYLIYHADEGDWARQCDRERGFIFEDLRQYLRSEWRRAGLSFDQANEACGTVSMAGRHYFSRSQWCLPTAEHYASLRQYANSRDHNGEYLRREYEDLRREYEDLRREYEDLRYTFNNPGKVSSVWQIPPAARVGWHPTPKPRALLRCIVETTSNPGDMVLDFFLGSGMTLLVAEELGRDCIGVDINAEYCRKAEERIGALAREPRLL